MLTIQDIQDHFLLTLTAETFTDPAALGKLVQLTKENGIQAIMENTTVDPINNQGKPQGSGRKLLRSHQENKNLHTKMLDKPDIARSTGADQQWKLR